MTLHVPATLSVLVSVWMESVFYGMNVIIYVTCLYIFVSRKVRRSYKIQNGLVVLSTLLFSSATAHMAINVRRLIEGYVLPPTKAAMNDYLSDITQPTDVVKRFLVVTTYFFSDFMITWRVHIVWAYNWRITLVPLLLCLSVLASGLGSAVSVAVAQAKQSIVLHTITRFSDAFISMSLITNVTTTVLIASRIWWVTRSVSSMGDDSSTSLHSHPSPSRSRRGRGGGSAEGAFNTWKRRNKQYWRLVIVIVESAACAAFMQIIELAFYTSNFPGIHFVADSTVQVVAISPLLIIAFVGLTSDRAAEGWSTSVSYPSSSSAFVPEHGGRYGDNTASRRGGATMRGGGGGRFTGEAESGELPPMEFSVSFTENESEVGTRLTGKTDYTDAESSSAPHNKFGSGKKKQVEFDMPSNVEEVEIQNTTM
ncbi:hypothetical protein F5887DRAFT_1076151 [Amanita rubescens]|nr:hypothetical protein F5887DRAFT_1076151 [Amanita rubescens]